MDLLLLYGLKSSTDGTSVFHFIFLESKKQTNPKLYIFQVETEIPKCSLTKLLLVSLWPFERAQKLMNEIH